MWYTMTCPDAECLGPCSGGAERRHHPVHEAHKLRQLHVQVLPAAFGSLVRTALCCCPVVQEAAASIALQQGADAFHARCASAYARGSVSQLVAQWTSCLCAATRPTSRFQHPRCSASGATDMLQLLQLPKSCQGCVRLSGSMQHLCSALHAVTVHHPHVLWYRASFHKRFTAPCSCLIALFFNAMFLHAGTGSSMFRTSTRSTAAGGPHRCVLGFRVGFAKCSSISWSTHLVLGTAHTMKLCTEGEWAEDSCHIRLISNQSQPLCVGMRRLPLRR